MNTTTDPEATAVPPVTPHHTAATATASTTSPMAAERHDVSLSPAEPKGDADTADDDGAEVESVDEGAVEGEGEGAVEGDVGGTAGGNSTDAANAHDDAAPSARTSASARETVGQADPVCWICYETNADNDGEGSTLVSPCKCSGSLRTVHQECLLAWMAQTDATICPHCHHPYTVDDHYPSTLQRVCDHPWLPSVVAALVCGALFYAFHRFWTWVTTKPRATSAPSGSGLASSAMSGSRLLAMMGGGAGLPAHLLLLPQMGGALGGATPPAGMVGTTTTLTAILAEVEVFALLVMVVYGITRYIHSRCTEASGSGSGSDRDHAAEGQEDRHTDTHVAHTDASDTDRTTNLEYDGFGGFTTTATECVGDLCDTVDNLWAESASGGGTGLSHEEALYALPFDVLTTLFYVVLHYSKRLQTWGVAKERAVRNYDAAQNNLVGTE